MDWSGGVDFTCIACRLAPPGGSLIGLRVTRLRASHF